MNGRGETKMMKWFMQGLSAVGLVLLVSRAPSAALPAAALGKVAVAAEDLVKIELSKRYAGARITLAGSVRWSGEAPSTPASIEVLSEPMRGVAVVLAQPGSVQGQVAFGAWVPAQIALKRVHPGERLLKEAFVQQDVNVTQGMAYEYRGLIVPADQELDNLEARQTVLEGQYLVATAVQKVPDLRRGDTIRVRILSGGVSLTTQGTAIDAAYVNGPARVSTAKRRELSGRLVPGGVVEVQL